MPAVVQRRNLARQVPRLRAAEDAVAAARRSAEEARRYGEPYLGPVRDAEAEVRGAEEVLRRRQAELEATPRWRRRGAALLVDQASEALAGCRSRLSAAESLAAPHVDRVKAADVELRRAEDEASVARIQIDWSISRFDRRPASAAVGRTKAWESSCEHLRKAPEIRKWDRYARRMSLAEVLDDLLELQELAQDEGDPKRRRAIDEVRSHVARRERGAKVSEAAAVLGISQPTVRAWIESGVLTPMPGTKPFESTSSPWPRRSARSISSVSTWAMGRSWSTLCESSGPICAAG